VEYPEIEEGAKPRHRFMSAYEQKKEAWDKSYQYLLFAADPYEVIAFKIPNLEVDRSDRFFSHWRAPAHPLTLQWTLHGTLHGTLFSHWRA
jgi:splicing factor 3A subunit 2